MKPTSDYVPAKRQRTEGREKIPQESMLEVLLWLDRFDLDGNQITTRRLRSLAENKRMPLRKVHRVNYDCAADDYSHNPDKGNTLRIYLEKDETGESFVVEVKIETDADALKAVSYLSSCFVSDFSVYGRHRAFLKNAIIAAPALIDKLGFQHCDFNRGEADALSETLNGSTFRGLALISSNVPVWQIGDKRLESLRLRGCTAFHVFSNPMEPDDHDRFEVTEEGILDYCFTQDDDLPLSVGRALRVPCATMTPAFFSKVVEASKNSPLTCDVVLSLEHLRFDVGNLDLGVLVLPKRSQEYDRVAMARMHNIRYDIADHGNGIRLLIHFKSEHGETWEAVVRHGKKEHRELFGPQPDFDAYWD